MVDQIRFLNASVTSIDCQLGWNQQSSTLSIGLVEDDGDLFLPKTNPLAYIGKPFYLSFGSLNYGGILSSWVEDNSIQGKPIYTVQLVDPREILDGSQVVLNHFQNPGNLDQVVLKEEMPNLFNVFDYFESAPYGTFGGAGVNEAGMLWEQIKIGILGIQDNYGPLKHNGSTYYLDFTGLPSAPNYYRIGGDALSLLDLVSFLCEDAGADFFVRLEQRGTDNWITFHHVSRTSQPTLGQIQIYVDSKTNVADANKTVSSNYKGVEHRNEVVSMILLGGDREDIEFISEADYIKPFWGFDLDGNTLCSDNYADTTSVTLNSMSIYDIVQSTLYTTKVIELRAALYNFEMWASAVERHNPGIATLLDLDGWLNDSAELLEEIQKEGVKPIKLNKTKKETVRKQGQIATGKDDKTNRVTRVYEFVKGMAEQFYGKSFLIKLDRAQQKIVPESGEIVYSYEVGDTGYLPPGSEVVIGLDGINQDIFQDELGKYIPFARFDNVSEADLTNVNPDDIAVEDNGATIFMKMSLEPFLVPSNKSAFGQTSCVVTMNSPIIQTSAYTVGNARDLVALALQVNSDDVTDEQIDQYMKIDSNTVGIRMPVAIIPRASIPTVMAVPLKSNQYSYGPWRTAAFTPGGKVRFEKDPSLVPWNFGGYNALDAVAQARVQSVYTGMMAGEIGAIEEAGLPTVNLGDAIKVGGPNVTSINISYGTQGITTNYQMQTYTPKFGAFSLQNAERLQRSNLNAQRVRRESKALQRRGAAINQVKQGTIRPYLQSVFEAAKRFGGSPHEGICAYVDQGPEIEEGNRKYTTVSTDIAVNLTSKFIGNPRKGEFDDEFQKMGAVGLEGLYRPYCTKEEDFTGNDSYVPKYVVPTVSGNGFPNNRDINPFKSGHDIDIVLKGDTEYEEFILKSDDEGTNENLRPVGFKGPPVVVGWGYDQNGLPIPHDLGDIKVFASGYLQKPHWWKSGPLDIRWDERRGVWVGGSFIYKVRAMATLSNPGTIVDGMLMRYDAESSATDKFIDTDKKVKISTFLRNITISSGTRCFCTLDESGYGLIISAEC